MKNEIEVKLKIALDQKMDLQNYLKEYGSFLRLETQKDEYFVPCHENFMDCDYPYKWLRLRKSNKGDKITFKHFFPENAECYTFGKEYETSVENVDTLRQIFSELNFNSVIVIDKIREVWVCDGYEFCFDTIKNLGEFIEIEKIDNTENPEREKEILLKMLSKWNIVDAQIIKKGYPLLMIEKLKEPIVETKRKKK